MLSPNAFGLLWLRVQVLIFFLPVMNYANTHKYIETRSLLKKRVSFFFEFLRVCAIVHEGDKVRSRMLCNVQIDIN
jgi:hypothetical protein